MWMCAIDVRSRRSRYYLHGAIACGQEYGTTYVDWKVNHKEPGLRKVAITIIKGDKTFMILWFFGCPCQDRYVHSKDEDDEANGGGDSDLPSAPPWSAERFQKLGMVRMSLSPSGIWPIMTRQVSVWGYWWYISQ